MLLLIAKNMWYVLHTVGSVEVFYNAQKAESCKKMKEEYPNSYWSKKYAKSFPQRVFQ